MEWNDDIEAGMEITLLSVTNMSEDDTCKLHVELLRRFAYESETSETDTETDSYVWTKQGRTQVSNDWKHTHVDWYNVNSNEQDCFTLLLFYPEVSLWTMHSDASCSRKHLLCRNQEYKFKKGEL